MQYHPHVHLIVPAGGLDGEGLWRPYARPDFLAPVRTMSKMFRGKLMAAVKGLWREGELELGGCASWLAAEGAMQSLIDSMYSKGWVAYCKPPFRDAGEVLKYLGRYTRRVAISNARLASMEGGRVSFRCVLASETEPHDHGN